MARSTDSFSRILVPTDFSPASDQALRQAAVLARAYDLPIHLVHVIAMHGGDPVEAERQLPDCVPEDLLAVVEERSIERALSPELGILHVCRDDDLVVMGTHGHTGLKHVLLGSTAERMVQLARVPVVTVRPTEQGGRVASPSKILCPVDFSSSSTEALDHAADLAKRLDAQLIVAHVVEPVLYPVAYGVPAGSPLINIEEQAKKGAQEALAPMVAELAARGVEATSLVESGTASLRITSMVEDHGVDLVVMATHGLTGFQHLLLGSTAERVVRRCPVPVLTVKMAPSDETEPSSTKSNAVT